MRTTRIHITGASGAGVTTLGRAVAGAYAIPHHDTDDYFWLPTDPPFTKPRPIADRIRLMREIFLPRPGWVLSGSIGMWAREIEPCFDCVIFMSAPTDVRMLRLQSRERTRLGRAATAPGNGSDDEVTAFLQWAAGYDDPSFGGRSRARHEAWLGGLPCPVIRLDGTRPSQELVAQFVADWPPPASDTDSGRHGTMPFNRKE